MSTGQAQMYEQEREQSERRFLVGIRQIPLQSWVDLLETINHVTMQWNEGRSMKSLAIAIAQLVDVERAILSKLSKKGSVIGSRGTDVTTLNGGR